MYKFCKAELLKALLCIEVLLSVAEQHLVKLLCKEKLIHCNSLLFNFLVYKDPMGPCFAKLSFA
jgi:hypothetical protein